MTDPQHRITCLREEEEARQATDAEYWERLEKYMPQATGNEASPWEESKEDDG